MEAVVIYIVGVTVQDILISERDRNREVAAGEING
jgi:hypothetical protein